MRILSLSCVFPNPAQPQFGTFVRSRLQCIGSRAEVKVLAPLPWMPFSAAVDRRALRAIPRKRRDDQLEILHPRWIYPPGGLPLNPVLLAMRLTAVARRLEDEFPFDLLDSHFGYPDGIAACLLSAAFRKPFFVTLRGNETMHAQSPLVRRAMAFTFRRAARVIALSKELERFATSLGADPSRVKVIPNGVDARVFYRRERDTARREFSLGGPLEKIVLSAGALIERKGHHQVVRALHLLKSRGIAARLVIAGGPGPEGRFEAQIRSAVQELDLTAAVLFTGRINQEALAKLMSAADVLVLASTREGWPNVVHEALACGTPVVAASVGAVPDMVPSGDYGFVLDRTDPSSIAGALETALARPWDRGAISEWAHRRSWDRVAEEVIGEMEQVIAQRG